MTIEKAIKILDENVILSPKASKFKEAIEVVKFVLEHQQAVINNLKKDCSVIEVNLEEAFLKECECEIEKAKEQAVREFAEKLKVFLLLSRPDQISAVSYEDIDNLVSKMFLEQKGEENAEVKYR